MTDFAAALYQNLPFPVLVVDAAAHVVSYNEAAARTFGWGKDHALRAGSPVIEGLDAEGVLAVALRAAGPLLSSLEADDGGPSPFAPAQTRAWVRELRHRRRLMEG